jgi:hypothetical protein
MSLLCDLSTGHVNRSPQELRRDGPIELGGGSLRILDWNGVKTADDFDPTYLHLSGEAETAARTNDYAYVP